MSLLAARPVGFPQSPSPDWGKEQLPRWSRWLEWAKRMGVNHNLPCGSDTGTGTAWFLERHEHRGISISCPTPCVNINWFWTAMIFRTK